MRLGEVRASVWTSLGLNSVLECRASTGRVNQGWVHCTHTCVCVFVCVERSGEHQESAKSPTADQISLGQQ